MSSSLPSHLRIVVHHQHLKAFQKILPFPLPLPLLVVGYQLKGNCDGEGAAFVLFALHADGSAHELHQIVDDGQAQAAAHIVAGIPRVLLLKGLEDPLHEFFRHADAVVPDHKLQVDEPVGALLLADVHPHFPSRRGELQGVGEQVVHNLLQAHLIAHLLLQGLGIDDLIQLLRKGFEVKELVGDLHFVSLDLGHV